MNVISKVIAFVGGEVSLHCALNVTPIGWLPPQLPLVSQPDPTHICASALLEKLPPHLVHFSSPAQQPHLLMPSPTRELPITRTALLTVS